MHGQQPPSSAPPGWYPDPWAPGGLRWWSGLDWTAYAAPATFAKTDGWPIASLVTSLSGLGPVIVLAANGALDQKNADDYSGTEQEIARTIDSFEEQWDDDNGTAICNELFTEELAASYQGNCPSEWDDGFLVDMDVESIDVRGDTATVEANDSDVVDWTFEMTYVGGEWRIGDLESN